MTPEQEVKLVEDMTAAGLDCFVSGSPAVTQLPAMMKAALAVAYPVIRNAVLEEAANLCTAIIRDYDVLTADGKAYAKMHVQKAAKGMVSLVREDLIAMKTEGGE